MADYKRFCETDGRRSKVMAEVLAEIRAERGDPNWRPGALNGGYYMESRIQKKLRQMYREWLLLDTTV